MTAGLGRSPTANPDRNNNQIRLTDAEQAACQTAADKAGQPLATWMRDCVVAAANRAR